MLVVVSVVACLWAIPAGAFSHKRHHRAHLAASNTADTCGSGPGYGSAAFNESTVMRGAEIIGSGLNARVVGFANDEKGLLLGVNGATPNTTAPQHAISPSLGDPNPTDPSGRPFYPALYITDLTVNGANSTAGDFQTPNSKPWNLNGGQPFVNDVFGTWSTATVSGGTYKVNPPAGKNDWNLGPGADTPLDTSFNEGYGAEVSWNVNQLVSSAGQKLIPGHQYRIQVIEHDGDQNKSGGDAGEFCVNLGIPIPPGISTSAQTGKTVGTAITDQATLKGTQGATGTLTWTVYSDASCSTVVKTLQQQNVTGDGTYTSPSFTPTLAGTYYWIASFSGTNPVLSGKCGDSGETSVVNPASPGLATFASDTTIGGAIHDKAVLSNGFNPTGTITFNVYSSSDTSCSRPLNAQPSTLTASVNGNGTYTSPDYTPATAGSYQWVATYSGDANNPAPAADGCGDANETSKVNQAGPKLTTSAANGTAGQPITDTATLSGGVNPTGTITWNVYAFSDTSCSRPLNSQPSTLTTTVSGNGNYTSPSFMPPTAGSYQWVASYSGDTNNAAANFASGNAPGCNASGETSNVTPQTPTLTTTAVSGTTGQPIHDVAVLAGGVSPGGTITWHVYNGTSDTACTTPLEGSAITAAVNGNGTYTSPTFTPSAPGTYIWTATYSGDGNNSKVGPVGCNDPNEKSTVRNPPAPALAVTKLESFSQDPSTFTAGPITGAVGQKVYYEMDVINTGNTDLTITFADPGCDSNTLSGPVVKSGSFSSGTLSSQGELLWTCSHVLTAADVAGYTNTAKAGGTFNGTPAACPNNCQASVVAYSNSPGMSVVKLQRIGDTGSFTTSQLTGSVGDTVNYEIQVTNTGNDPLTLAISDPHCDSAPVGPSAVSGTLNGNVLAPGGVAQYTCSHVLAAGDIPQFTNVGTITGQPQCPPAASSCPPLSGTGIVVVNVTQAAIKVLKLQSLVSSGPFTTSTITAKVGQTIYYEIQATNTGNAPLTLAISDPMCDAGTLQGPVALSGTLSGGALSPNGEAQYTCSHVLTAGDSNPFTNTAVVTGTPPSGPPVSGTSSVTANKQAVRVIHVKKCPPGTVKKTKHNKKGKKVVVCKSTFHPKPPKHIRGFTGSKKHSKHPSHRAHRRHHKR